MIKRIAFTILAGISFVSMFCSADRKTKKNSISKVDLIYAIPIVELTGELEYLNDTVSIFYNQNSNLYRLPFTYSSENYSTLLEREKKYNYFIFKSNEAFGYYFDSIKSPDYRIMKVDSLLKLKAFWGNNYFDSKNDSLVSQEKNVAGYTLVEKYIPKYKPDDSYPDTTILYYNNKLDGFYHSFSKDLEQHKQLKIYKVRMIFKEQNNQQYNITVPYREFKFEFLKDSVSISSDIVSLFEKFESHSN